jgi:hypothetical protein
MSARTHGEEEGTLLHTAHSATAGADTHELSGSILPGSKRFCPSVKLQGGSAQDDMSQ